MKEFTLQRTPEWVAPFLEYTPPYFFSYLSGLFFFVMGVVYLEAAFQGKYRLGFKPVVLALACWFLYVNFFNLYQAKEWYPKLAAFSGVFCVASPFLGLYLFWGRGIVLKISLLLSLYLLIALSFSVGFSLTIPALQHLYMLAGEGSEPFGAYVERLYTTGHFSWNAFAWGFSLALLPFFPYVRVVRWLKARRQERLLQKDIAEREANQAAREAEQATQRAKDEAYLALQIEQAQDR